MRKLILAGALAFLAPSLAFADGMGVLQANPRNSGDVSGTIASTGVYQTVFPANTNRVGCDIQNQGAANMNVRVNGTTIFILLPYALFYCNNSMYTIVSLIEITGTATQAFAASSE
jgi:hypothetical protein